MDVKSLKSQFETPARHSSSSFPAGSPRVTHMESEKFRVDIPHISDTERNFARHVKLACLIIIALAIVYMAMDRLEGILIPFVLAVALSYLLTPLIDTLTCRGKKNCNLRMPRFLAVIISLLVAISVLFFIALILVHALATFKEKSDIYMQRVNMLFDAAIRTLERMQAAAYGYELDPENEQGRSAERSEEIDRMLNSFIKDVNISGIILKLLGKAAHVMEDVMYIILFLIFMLAHNPSPSDDGSSSERGDGGGGGGDAGDSARLGRKVERQIFVYIRGKSSISAFVGGCHALVLFLLGLSLWLPFGVLTFFLNFIPNVGGMLAVMLPLPLVALDPSFSGSAAFACFAIPFCVNLFAKDFLEPTLIGQSTSLHPVAVLLAILIYGSVWGITGMVMAIPLTAVTRIYLSSVEHPLPQYVARKLAGGAAGTSSGVESAAASPNSPRYTKPAIMSPMAALV